MKFFAFILVTIGFLGGAYSLIGLENNSSLIWFLICLGLGIAGVIMLRTLSRKQKGAQEKVSADIQLAQQSLQRLAQGMAALEREKDQVNVYDLSARIDQQFADDLHRFVEARESIIYACNLPAYADVMSQFAAAERYLNRVWSCSVDGYIDEAHKFLAHARDRFAEAQTKLEAHLQSQ